MRPHAGVLLAMVFKCEAQRPMRSLLTRLPQLPLTARMEIDFQAADPSLLVSLLDDAETTMNTINLGVGAIGHLLAHSAVVIDDGTLGSDALENIGFFIAEASDLAAICMMLASRCRRETADYQPDQDATNRQVPGKSR